MSEQCEIGTADGGGILMDITLTEFGIISDKRNSILFKTKIIGSALCVIQPLYRN